MIGEDMARILIVEDEFLIAMCIEDELREAGHEVVGIAARYETAVAMARAERPDLAIVDVRLASVRDGIDVALTLRRELDIPSVLATGSDHLANVRRAEAAEPLGWVPKPYMPRDLARLIDRLGPAVMPCGRQDDCPEQTFGKP
ncbi:response regulator [Rhodobacteraceae bacterium HSP-20]|uniref:Response regulator n=1 Tax=Paragemmobacter amnigenus TaxID=2852097 RepID=A0ABS6J0L6_9RHOB|nr:response regulator [Rhodobacter amnigenus]MBU9697309.1 response regulator [Rhodobacter amnigenus]MBV4388536.1 response regulator [Rhodobacter amnigenus]